MTNTVEVLVEVANYGSGLLGFATGVLFFIFLVYLIFDR